MNIEAIWKSFLNKIKEELNQPLLFDAWFQDTKLIELNDDYAKILVPMPIHKKHLKSNYNELIETIFNEITGSNFKIEYITEEELEQNIVIDIDNSGVPADEFESNLDQKHTFDNFIVGESNKFAKYNALAIAEKPGQVYNPLFIYGKSGLGKTHLMHAIGNYIVQNSNKKVLYITSDDFVNDFVEIYKHKLSKNNFDIVDKFKKKYRDLDVLIIDDIQYLEIAPTSQQEFFNTFNELHNNKKQIIIASDRSPDDLRKLEDNLLTRFNWGLTVDILPPDFDLRMNIIDNKITSYEMTFGFPQDVKEYIASNCTSDVRKLEGAINRVYAYATIMNGSNITLNLAIEALKDYFVKSIISKNKIDQVQQLIANYYNVSIDDLKSKKRNASIGVPRQIAMYICRIYLEEPFARIGSEFGGKDHTTVMHSVEKITNEIKKDIKLAESIDKIVQKIK